MTCYGDFCGFCRTENLANFVLRPQTATATATAIATAATQSSSDGTPRKASRCQMLIRTSREMMARGLELAGFDPQRQSVRYRQNLERFKSFYGSKPIVCAQIWEDLQTTDIEEARIEANNQKDVDYFLMAHHFLTCYPLENQRAGLFQVCETTTRSWCWYYVMKMQALKGLKVSSLRTSSASVIPFLSTTCHPLFLLSRLFGPKTGSLATKTSRTFLSQWTARIARSTRSNTRRSLWTQNTLATRRTDPPLATKWQF